MLLLWTPLAQAACLITQGTGVDLFEVRIQAQGNPQGCRQLFLDAPQIQEVRGWIRYPSGGQRKLKKDAIALLDGGIWEIIAPELMDGGELLVQGHVDTTLTDAPPITVAFTRPTPTYNALERLDQTWELVVNPKHPGWSFADPKQGYTRVDARWQTLPGAAAERYPIPPDVTVEGEGFVFRPGFLLSTADVTEAHYQVPGTPPQGDLVLPPGSLTLLGLVTWQVVLPEDGSKEVVEGGIRLNLPSGGRVQFRAERSKETAIIPDLTTFMAGLTERFRVASLPEPAIPTWLRAESDRDRLFANLFELVQGMPTLNLPGADLLHPRALNRAWRSGFGSEVEKGLILHRLLGQERFAALWAVTGEALDMTTLTGLDAVVVKTDAGWLDPGCAVCGVGEVATRRVGKVAIFMDGKTETLPSDWGTIDQQLVLNGTTFDVSIQLSGQAAVWLREQLLAEDRSSWPTRSAQILGAAGAEILEIKGLELWGSPISARFRLRQVPDAVVWPRR